MFASIPWNPMLLSLCCSALTLTPNVNGQAEAFSEVGFDRAIDPRAAMSAAEDDVPDGLSTEDWTEIRAAHGASHHAVLVVEGGHQARNPGQQWRTFFDGRGFRTDPDGGGWTWGLELVSYGFAGSEQAVTSPARVSAEGGRVAYHWDENLEEWYVNDTRGL